VNFVFHGGSGSEPEAIQEAIGYGVVWFRMHWFVVDRVQKTVLVNDSELGLNTQP
jgi:fructose/tagatose bisphosphate aldolase